MGFRRLEFLLSVTFIASLAACGDNKKPVFDDAGTMDMSMVDASEDAPPDAGCPVGQTLCGTDCVDVKTDNDHCGDCATDCGTGTCQTNNGKTMCCASGLTNCDGTCVDTTTNVDNCGTCGTDCGTGVCLTNGTFTTCCPTGQINCGGQCFDPMSDEANCGGCTADGAGAACTGATDTCCAGTCVDVDTATGNCGACGVDCSATPSDPTCTPPVNGTGTTSVCCGAGETNCGGTCTSLQTSDANCGGCGQACTVANTHCQAPDAGSTASTPACCLDTQNNCNGTCSNPLTDNNNCGGCGDPSNPNDIHVCRGSDTCQSGVCCGPQEINCNGVCVDPDTNPNACGGCVGGAGTGAVCTQPQQFCSDGDCETACDVGETSCSNACVTLSTDPNNCGTCGNKCAATQVCNNGTCTATANCTGGKINCNGECVDPLTDENHCSTTSTCPGTVCDPTDNCDGGLCCDAGTVNAGGVCCPVGWLACDVGGGVLQCKDPTDEATCGTCTNNCGTGTCTTGTGGALCCAPGTTRCGSSCVPLNTNSNCGACGTTCDASETCRTSNPAGGATQCCDTASELNCDGACVNKLTDDNNCGMCDVSCGTSGECSNGKCCPNGSTSYFSSDGTRSICCTADKIGCDIAGTMTCIDLDANGTCGTTCGDIVNCTGMGQVCVNNQCTANCGSLTNCSGSCYNTTNDPQHCGSCTGVCPLANQTCAPTGPGGTGQCQPCAVGPAGGCGGACVDTQTNNTNCGGCAGAGGVTCDVDENCQQGHCCENGKTWCPTANACVDLNANNGNCGSCGNACSGGSVCQGGTCGCAFGQDSFPVAKNLCAAGACYTTSIDPDHCGPSCQDCTGTQVCVSGGCKATCPAPLTNCAGEADDLFPFRHCTNLDSDSQNCGACGNDCPAGTGCSAGSCVPLLLFPVPTTPAKCVGGGPPISVPTAPNGGGQQCTGNLGAVSFLFGLCSRTNLGPVSRDIITDAFNSQTGPYVASCTTDPNCGTVKRCTITGTVCSVAGDCTGTGNTCDYAVKCIGGVCSGGGIGINGRVLTTGTPNYTYLNPLASNSATTDVGGDFWTFGTVGLAVKGITIVRQNLKNGPPKDLNGGSFASMLNGPFDFGKNVHVYGNADIKGAITSGGNSSMLIDGQLRTRQACNTVPNSVTATGGCVSQNFPDLSEPCGAYDNSDKSLLPIAEVIVPYFRDPTHNDNAAIGLKYNALDDPPGALHVDLPCGVYYLNSINAGQPITISVHGRTALIVGGAVRISQEMIFDLDATASLDIFVGGVLNVSNNTTLGSPAYPARTRMYFGSPSCGGGSATCNDPTDCCSGTCTACPVDATGKPTGACTGTGTCVGGGGNLAQSISLSQGGNFNGLLWAGYGTFTHSNPLEMYGSIYAKYFDASGITTVHYDKGAAELGEECPPIPPGSACESTRDCGGTLVCLPGNTCGACTSEGQCIPPKTCVAGSCI